MRLRAGERPLEVETPHGVEVKPPLMPGVPEGVEPLKLLLMVILLAEEEAAAVDQGAAIVVKMAISPENVPLPLRKVMPASSATKKVTYQGSAQTQVLHEVAANVVKKVTSPESVPPLQPTLGVTGRVSTAV